MSEPKQTGGRGKIQPRWKKGQSGNPKGKPPTPPQLKEMVEIMPDLPTVLAKCLAEKKGDMTAVEAGIRRTIASWINAGNINAGRLILEYAYGKPKEMGLMNELKQEYAAPVININLTEELLNKPRKKS